MEVYKYKHLSPSKLDGSEPLLDCEELFDLVVLSEVLVVSRCSGLSQELSCFVKEDEVANSNHRFLG